MEVLNMMAGNSLLGTMVLVMLFALLSHVIFFYFQGSWEGERGERREGLEGC